MCLGPEKKTETYYKYLRMAQAHSDISETEFERLTVDMLNSDPDDKTIYGPRHLWMLAVGLETDYDTHYYPED